MVTQIEKLQRAERQQERVFRYKKKQWTVKPGEEKETGKLLIFVPFEGCLSLL